MTDRPEIHATLISLEQEGRLTAAIVVEEARDPESPLHGAFEWSNEVAAERHREAQARELIRSFKIQVQVHSVIIKAPEFVRNPDQPSGYVAVTRLRGDEDRARDAVVTEFARAAAALSRARTIAAALGMGTEIDKLIEGVSGLTVRATSTLHAPGAA